MIYGSATVKCRQRLSLSNFDWHSVQYYCGLTVRPLYVPTVFLAFLCFNSGQINIEIKTEMKFHKNQIEAHYLFTAQHTKQRLKERKVHAR